MLFYAILIFPPIAQNNAKIQHEVNIKQTKGA